MHYSLKICIISIFKYNKNMTNPRIPRTSYEIENNYLGQNSEYLIELLVQIERIRIEKKDYTKEDEKVKTAIILELQKRKALKEIETEYHKKLQEISNLTKENDELYESNDNNYNRWTEIQIYNNRQEIEKLHTISECLYAIIESLKKIESEELKKLRKKVSKQISDQLEFNFAK